MVWLLSFRAFTFFNFHVCFVSSFGNIQVFYYSISTPTHAYATHIQMILSLRVMAGSNGGQENTHIGFYQFERVIGKGNFAVVKLATHSITDIKVFASLSLSLPPSLSPSLSVSLSLPLSLL